MLDLGAFGPAGRDGSRGGAHHRKGHARRLRLEQSLIQCVALFKGLKLAELEDIRQNLPLSLSVAELTATLK